MHREKEDFLSPGRDPGKTRSKASIGKAVDKQC